MDTNKRRMGYADHEAAMNLDQLLYDLVKEEGMAFWQAVFHLAECHWGLCPDCCAEPMILNVWKDHFAYCEPCHTYWPVGYNLMSGWMYESEIDWQRNREKLSQCREVESLHGFDQIRKVMDERWKEKAPFSADDDIPF